MGIAKDWEILLAIVVANVVLVLLALSVSPSCGGPP